DPTLYLKARAIEQLGRGAIVDITLAVSPSIQDARLPSSDVSGTGGRGGETVLLGLEMGTKTSTYELVGGVGFEKQFDVTLDDESTKVNIEGGDQFMSGLGYRYIPGKSFDIRSTFQLAHFAKQKRLVNG